MKSGMIAAEELFTALGADQVRLPSLRFLFYQTYHLYCVGV